MTTKPECPEPCPEPGTFTLCDGDRTNNRWVENGVCLLDNLDASQIVFIIERDEDARADLKRVTTCEEILCLANTVPRLPTYREEDKLQSAFNNTPNSLPFYTLFRGNLSDV